jgi:hypothetical protein
VPQRLVGIPTQYFGVLLRNMPRRTLLRTMSVVGKVSALIRGAPPLPLPNDSPCAAVPLIGFHLADAVKAGRIQLAPGVSGFTSDGVEFVDGSLGRFDTVILATGYRAALGIVPNNVHRDPCGFALRRDRVVSADAAGLYFVGHNYDVSGGLYNIAKDARLTARFIARDLRDRARSSRADAQ